MLKPTVSESPMMFNFRFFFDCAAIITPISSSAIPPSWMISSDAGMSGSGSGRNEVKFIGIRVCSLMSMTVRS